MRKSIFTFLTLGLLFSQAFAQIENQGVPYGQNLRTILNDKMANEYNGNGQSVYSVDFSKNPFIFKEWHYAKIKFEDGKVVDSLMLNYDDKQSTLLVTMAESINPFTLKTNSVAEFTFYNSPTKPYLGKKKSEFVDVDKPYGFYEKVYGNADGTGVTVLKTFVKKFRSADDQVNYGSVSTPEGKFDLYTRYYIKEGDGKFDRLSLSKKSIQNLIGKAKMKEAQKLLKSKKLKWGDEEALVALLETYK